MEVFDEAAAFQCPMSVTCLGQNTDSAYHNNELRWSGDSLKLTALKKEQEGDDIVMRWVNLSDKVQTLTVEKSDWIKNLYRSDIIEEKRERLVEENGRWSTEIKPYEIVTFIQE